MKKIFITIFCFSFFIFSQAQPPSPVKIQDRALLLKAGIIHIGNGQIIQNGSILFENGKIIEIGINVNSPTNAEIIDVNGKHIYPGLISPNTHLGLTEVDAVRSTVDYEEVVDFQPNVRSLIAYNTDSEIIPTVRSNGILIAQPTPSGGIISGTSSIVQLDAWNWEDAAYKIDDGIHTNFPSMYRRAGFFDEGSAIIKNENRIKIINEIDKTFSEALAYSKISNHDVINLKFEAMRGLFDGTKNLYVHADYGKEIIESIKLFKSKEIKKIVLMGGDDAWQVTDFLKENNISVILSSLHRLPTRSGDDVDMPFKIPALLHKAGILVSLSYADGRDPMGSRNLPFLAGTASAHGLTKEEALSMVTLNTAKILGIETQTGSLEKGKDANIVVIGWRYFRLKTNNITYAFIQGRKITLDDRNKRLYRKFSEKFEKKKE